MTAKGIWRNWPTVFTVCVAVWFLIVASGILHADPSISLPSHKATTNTTAGATVLDNLSVRVLAFKTTGTDANVTLEVKDNANNDITFVPNDLQVVAANGATLTPTSKGPGSIKITKHLSQLVPVSFPLTSMPFGPYRVLYQGQQVFSGSPF